MSYSKNEKIELDIIDMTKDGLGVAKVDSQVFFVKNAILEDRVNAVITKVTTNVIYAKALDLVNKSKYRVRSKCDVSNSCGGCQLLSLDYKKQIELKKQIVLNTISKIGKISLEDLNKCYEGVLDMDTPYRFRNKMQVPFAIRDGKVVYGFFATRTHHIIEFDDCLSGFKGSDEILKIIREAIIKYNLSVYDENTNKGVFREVLIRCANVSSEISLTYIINDNNHDKNLELYKAFDNYIVEEYSRGEVSRALVTSTLNINTSNTNVLFGNKNIILRGTGYIEDSIGNIKYHISPESFYQVNMQMTKSLYDKVLEYAAFTSNENVLDLYCGIGTISLYIADKVGNVLGIEIVEKAVENAKSNAALNNISNAKFICLDASKITKDIISSNASGVNFDTVVVDPPRRGLDKATIDLIRDIDPKKIIYVSCDPATLARDIDILCNIEKKYSIQKFVNVDMFPHTMHIETVVSLIHV
ncbi:MAG: 23S rRNA (uracil(1939)-C(5))-methyltransferase RlmD [Lachnospiraceae bacterium]|nr:23S rRNA (uracil(1939)-C(5))-methyltransferase RlmD [Lachnospiraceae bacterium]